MPQIQQEIIATLSKEPNDRNLIDLDAIQKSTKDIPFFKKYISAGDKTVHQKCCKFMRVEHFQKDETIFLLDSIGTKFYLILSGKVGVYIRLPKKAEEMAGKHTTTNEALAASSSPAAATSQNPLPQQDDDSIICVKELHVGEAFGELALLNNRPRLASIISHSTNLVLAVLDKKDFSEILKEKEEAKLLSEMGFFAKMPFFQGWNFNLVKHLYLNVFRVKYQKGDHVFEENSQPNAVFIITAGEFDLMSYHPFELFGEEDILNGMEKRTFSAKCVSVSGECIMIKRRDLFFRILKDEGAHAYLHTRLAAKNERMEAKIESIRTSLHAFSEFRYNDFAGLKQAKDVITCMLPNQRFSDSLIKNHVQPKNRLSVVAAAEPKAGAKISASPELLNSNSILPSATTTTTTTSSGATITVSTTRSPTSSMTTSSSSLQNSPAPHRKSSINTGYVFSSSSYQLLSSPPTKVPQGLFPTTISKSQKSEPPLQSSSLVLLSAQNRPKTTSLFQTKHASQASFNNLGHQYSIQVKSACGLEAAAQENTHNNLSIPSPITTLDSPTVPSLVVLDPNSQNNLIPGVSMTMSVSVSARATLPSATPPPRESSNDQRKSRLSMLIDLSAKSREALPKQNIEPIIDPTNNNNTNNNPTNEATQNNLEISNRRSHSHSILVRNTSISVNKEQLLAAESQRQSKPATNSMSKSCITTPQGISLERKSTISINHTPLSSISRQNSPNLFQQTQHHTFEGKSFRSVRPRSNITKSTITISNHKNQQGLKSELIPQNSLNEKETGFTPPIMNRKVACSSVYFNSVLMMRSQDQMPQQYEQLNSYKQQFPSGGNNQTNLQSNMTHQRQRHLKQLTWQRIDSIIDKMNAIKINGSFQSPTGDPISFTKYSPAEFSALPNSIVSKQRPLTRQSQYPQQQSYQIAQKQPMQPLIQQSQ